MREGDTVNVTRKGRVLLTGVLEKCEWDDYIGNPEKWAPVKPKKGRPFAFRSHDGREWMGVSKTMRRRGYVRIEVLKEVSDGAE